MATENYIAESIKAYNESHYLVEIELTGTGSLYDANKTLYISDTYITIGTTYYEGILLSSFDIFREIVVGSISELQTINIELSNCTRMQFFKASGSDNRMSDLLPHFYFVGAKVTIRKWYTNLSDIDDAEVVFQGDIRDFSYDTNKINFNVASFLRIDTEIPYVKVTLDDYSDAPSESIGQVIPHVYGAFEAIDWSDTDNNAYSNSWPIPFIKPNSVLTKLIKVEQKDIKLLIAAHKVKHADLDLQYPNALFIWDNNSKLLAHLHCSDHAYSGNTEPSYLSLNPSQNKALIYADWIIPFAEIGANYSVVAGNDYSAIINYDDSDYVSMAAGDILVLKTGTVPKGIAEIINITEIQLVAEISNVSGSSPYGHGIYFNDGYNNGAGGNDFNTGGITGNGIINNNLITFKGAKGIRSDQDDQDDPWKFSDIASYEFGIKCNTGCSFRIHWMYLIVRRAPYSEIAATRTSIHKHTKIKKNFFGKEIFRITTEKKDTDKVDAQFQDSPFFCGLPDGGRMFGQWIDRGFRVNGYDEDDLIENPVYIIESILRDILHFSDDEIFYPSFDELANTLFGYLKDWKFSGGIYEVQSARDIIDNLLQQCHCSLFKEDGKWVIVKENVVSYCLNETTGDNLLNNPSFETAGGGGADVFANWTEENYDATYRIILQDGATSTDGSYSCKLQAAANDGTTDFAVRQSIPLTGDTWYRLTFDYYYYSRTQGELEFFIYDGTNAEYLTPVEYLEIITYDWKSVTINFKCNTTSANTIIQVGIENETNGIAYFDNFDLREISSAHMLDHVKSFSKNFKIEMMDIDTIITGIDVKYHKDIVQDNYCKNAYCRTEKKLVSYLAEDLTTDECVISVEDGSVFTAGDFIQYNNEINRVLSISTNDLTLYNSATIRTQYKGTKAATHNLSDAIYIIDDNSDDGDGSTADTAKELLCTMASWRYHVVNNIELECDWIYDKDTAVLLRDELIDIHTVKRHRLRFSATLAASHWKLGSIITIDSSVTNASNFLLYNGATWNAKYFRIKQKTYRNNGIDIVATELL
jgi:hypothetical protein